MRTCGNDDARITIILMKKKKKNDVIQERGNDDVNIVTLNFEKQKN